jgi:hypothetical protein
MSGLLTTDQKSLLKKHGLQYGNWLSEGNGKDSTQEHRDHEKYIQEKLSKENVDKLTENQFTEIYAKLWVSKKWGAKSELLIQRKEIIAFFTMIAKSIKFRVKRHMHFSF